MDETFHLPPLHELQEAAAKVKRAEALEAAKAKWEAAAAAAAGRGGSAGHGQGLNSGQGALAGGTHGDAVDRTRDWDGGTYDAGGVADTSGSERSGRLAGGHGGKGWARGILGGLLRRSGERGGFAAAAAAAGALVGAVFGCACLMSLGGVRLLQRMGPLQHHHHQTVLMVGAGVADPMRAGAAGTVAGLDSGGTGSTGPSGRGASPASRGQRKSRDDPASNSSKADAGLAAGGGGASRDLKAVSRRGEAAGGVGGSRRSGDTSTLGKQHPAGGGGRGDEGPAGAVCGASPAIEDLKSK